MKKRETDDAIFIELEEGDLHPTAYTHHLKPGEVTRGYGSDVDLQIEGAATEILGDHGRMLSMSKSAYRDAHPNHEIYFNGCIFDGHKLGPRARRRARQIWFGDLDLTVDAERLQQLADRVGPIIVTPETPYRFKGLPKRPRKLEAIPEIHILRPQD